MTLKFEDAERPWTLKVNLPQYMLDNLDSTEEMFAACANLLELQVIKGNIDMQSIKNDVFCGAEYMFRGCSRLTDCHLINVPDFVTAEMLGLTPEQFDKFTLG